MSERRVLLGCAVLSLQDACVFYPCCKGCFSRIDAEPQDTTRYRCSRCGYMCLREQVDYRYRLSLRVARDRRIFGITVFGNSLNPFFGIHATGLQRLVETPDGPIESSARLSLLLKAVEDCFIGRHFIFGIKLTETESELCFEGPASKSSSTKDAAQFVASQMILPKATGLRGCTVASYYRTLLQKASEYKVEAIDPNKASRFPATPLLLISGPSPSSSFNNSTLSACCLLSQSLQRTQHQDCTLTPTPPWHQSLGVVTSSAEQEGEVSTQDSGDGNNGQTDENHKATEERTPLPKECSFYSSPSFSKNPNLTYKNNVGNSSILNNWFSPTQHDHKRYSLKEKRFSTSQLTRTFLSSSVTWEDMPFSENLTEFLCEENKDLNIVRETEPNLNVHHQKETARNNPEITTVTTETTSACQRNTHQTDSHSQILQDIMNIPASDGCDRHHLVIRGCENPFEHVNRSQATIVCSHKSNLEDEEASCLSSDREEEQLEEEAYNCSADLFGSSLMISMNTQSLNTHAQTVSTTTEACPLFSKTDQRHLKNENAHVTHSTPGKQKQKSNKCNKRDSFIPQDFDFVPPSQSTPIVKLRVVSQSFASLHRNLMDEFSSQPDRQDSGAFHGNLCELDSKKSVKTTSVLSKMSAVSANLLLKFDRETSKENLVRSRTSSRCSHKLIPETRLWKLDKLKKHLQAQQHLRVQREAQNLRPTGIIHRKLDSGVCDVTACDNDNSELLVPPTPAGKSLSGVILRRRKQIDCTSNSRNLTFSLEGQRGDTADCKKTRLDPSVMSSQGGMETTGRDSETVDGRNLDGLNDYLLDDENRMCDWSRDLFSDSV